MLNIIIPMAGFGSRFADQGYQDPKPFIPVRGKPMIRVVADNIRPSRQQARLVIVTRSELLTPERRAILHEVGSLFDDFKMVILDRPTEGAAQTVVCGIDAAELYADDPLVISNCDEFLRHFDMDHFTEMASMLRARGLLVTTFCQGPKWSYVGRNDLGEVDRVVEKQVISDEGTCGVYWFRQTQDFLDAYCSMKQANDRHNGELYVAPIYTHLLRAHPGEVHTYRIPRSHFHGLGTPEDLREFLTKSIAC